MKKILYGLTLMAAMASCTENYDDWAQPQSQPAEDAKTVTFTVTQAADVDFANIPAQTDVDAIQTVKLFQPSITAEEGTVTTYKALLWDADKTDSEELDADSTGSVPATELKSAVEMLYGKAPTPRAIPIDVTAYTAAGSQTIASQASTTLNVTLVAPHISQNYYVVGGTLDWAASAASKEQKFQHSDENVYDDPIFTITLPLGDGETWFAIGDDEALDAITNNSDWSKLLGTTSGNGNSGDAGFLAPRSELSDDGSFKVSGGKFAKITLDMMNGSYTVEVLNFDEFIYVPGNAQGWNPGGAAALQSPNFDGVYTGYVYLDGGFKFTKARNWDAEYNWNDFSTVPDYLNNGAGIDTNLYCDAPGMYYLTVDVANGTISGTKIDNMNLVGDFNGWNQADDSQRMTWDAENVCYVITGAGVTANGWKFTANNSWDINLGGTIDNLVANGDNLSAVGTTIKLYPCRNASDKMYCTVE